QPLFYTHGAAVADYDNDGWPDLLVTGWGRLALYHNEPDGKGGRHFVEVTQKAGLTDKLWSTSAAWADFDGHGFPDLYVCHYLNNGDGTFTDVSKEAGLKQGSSNEGKGLGVLAVDLNDDRKPDIYVANDTVDNFLYMNYSSPGRIWFEEVGLSSGVARDDSGI